MYNDNRRQELFKHGSTRSSVRNFNTDATSNSFRRQSSTKKVFLRRSSVIEYNQTHFQQSDAKDNKLHTPDPEMSYCTANHISVMTQMHGSVWPRVLPFCITNTISCAIIYLVDHHYTSIHIALDPIGHKYLSALVSFLVIARLKIIYATSIKAEEKLTVVTHNMLELVECTAALNAHNTTQDAIDWRRNVSFGAIKMLKDCIDALGTNSDDRRHKLTKEEIQERIKLFKTPTHTALALKQTIMSHRHALSDDNGTTGLIAIPQAEQHLIGFVDNCLNAFYSIDKMIHTQYPFPLVQMGRTILLFWIYTLPFALEHDNYSILGVCMLIFILTYGFVGLESACIEMSDPFANGANHFDYITLAKNTVTDIYLILYRYHWNNRESVKLKQEVEQLFQQSPVFSGQDSDLEDFYLKKELEKFVSL